MFFHTEISNAKVKSVGLKMIREPKFALHEIHNICYNDFYFTLIGSMITNVHHETPAVCLKVTRNEKTSEAFV